MKIIKKKPAFELLNSELRKWVKATLEEIGNTHDTLLGFLDEHLKKFDSITSELIKIELSSRNIDEEMTTKKNSIKKRIDELNTKEAEIDLTKCDIIS